MDEQSVRQSPSNILWGFELLVVTADALFLAGWLTTITFAGALPHQNCYSC